MHKLPFDPDRFRADVKSANARGAEEEAAWAAQYRENWDNARLVVAACAGTMADIDIDCFSYGPFPGRDDNQVPWLETVLDSGPGRTTVGFYLHYLEQGSSLWYGDFRLDLPKASPAPGELLNRMPYESPD